MTHVESFSADSYAALHATSDYFWMLSEGIIDQHTRSTWSTFSHGYATMDAHLARVGIQPSSFRLLHFPSSRE